jgi:flagellar protein FliO/FliZ
MIETADVLRYLSVLALVLGLFLVLTWVMRRLGMGVGGRPGRRRRLSLVETLALDGRHRLVLVRCDERDHLLLLGPSGDLVVDRDCPPPPRFAAMVEHSAEFPL